MAALLRLEKTAGGLLALLVRTDTTLSEFWSSTLLLAWALFFSFPISMPRSNAMKDLIDLTHPVGGRWMLAGLCVTAGIAQAVSNLTRHRRWRRKIAFSISILYGFLCLLAYYALAGAIFVYTSAVSSFVMGIVYLRLSLPWPRPWVDPE